MSAPPPYSFQRPMASLERTRPRTIRSIVLFFAVIGTIWATVFAVNHFRYMSSSGETSGMRTFDLILGVFLIVAAVSEAFGIFCAVQSNARIARIYAIASIVVTVVAFATGILSLVMDEIYKDEEQLACTANLTGTTVSTGWFGSSSTTFTQAQAESYCKNSWSRGMWYDGLWLAGTTLLALFENVIVWTFYKQLKNPRGTQNHMGGVPLATYNTSAPAYVPDYVPQYPGPPASGSMPNDFKNAEEEQAWNRAVDYSHVSAESPTNERGYDLHPAGRGNVGAVAQEEEAWERAQREGGTSHLMGNNPFADSSRREEGDDELRDVELGREGREGRV